MIARKNYPSEFADWNVQWGAPYGHSLNFRMAGLVPDRLAIRVRGPFSLQPNSDTRRFEYPWAFFAADIHPGLRVLEIGGGLSGFQFVLSKCGTLVENIDPGMTAKGKGWQCTPERIQHCNRVFRTNVVLHNCDISKAQLTDGSYDRAYSISAIEHFADEEVTSTLGEVYRCLKPGGLFILTTDLFLDISPFSSGASNSWGKNVNLWSAIEKTAFELVAGDKRELFGFGEFDSDRVMRMLPELLMSSTYPVLVQTLVLRKPVHSTSKNGH
jgi:hypothetical protein